MVKQDENDEPASELLEGLDRESARLVKEKGIKRSQPAPPVERDDEPFLLPVSWGFARLDRVCSFVTDGEHKTPSREPSGEIPLGTAKNIRDGYLDLTVA